MLIRIHSLTDLITNSSTVIFTYHSNTIDSLKGLINEILDLIGESKRCDELFKMGVVCEDWDQYSEYLEDPDFPELKDMSNVDLNKIISGIEQGNDPPPWFERLNNEALQSENYLGYMASQSIYLVPLDPKYKGLAQKIINFLNAPQYEATRDG